MHADEFQTNALSERIIGCASRVLKKGITVYYNGVVGEYVADLVVEETVVVELKASRHSTLRISHNA